MKDKPEFVSDWKFNLNQVVTINVSRESGEVIGRAEFNYAEPSYLIRYMTGDGRAVENWWTESALDSANE